MLNKLLDKSREYDLQKHDTRAPAVALELTEDGRVRLPATEFGEVRPLRPTDWAWRQMFRKLGTTVFGKGSKRGLPADYLLAIPKELLAMNTNKCLEKSKSQWLVRGYGDNCRAVLDRIYADVSNTEVLEAVQQVLDETQAVGSVRPHLTPDYVHGRIALRDLQENGGRQNFAVGFAFRNGEVGNSALTLSPFIQRHSCANSIIWGDNGLRVIHRGSRKALMVQFKAAIANALPTAATMVDSLIEADNEEIDISAVLRSLAKQHGWGEPVQDAILIGTEGRQTRAGLVNGVSYAAHTAVDEPTDQYELEVLAGSLLLQ